jgi:pimeloyl-ACP methyl ester carboxylesterase
VFYPDDILNKVTVPLFMICGANDCFFNFKKAKKRIKKLIPHSKTVMFEK